MAENVENSDDDLKRNFTHNTGSESEPPLKKSKNDSAMDLTSPDVEEPVASTSQGIYESSKTPNEVEEINEDDSTDSSDSDSDASDTSDVDFMDLLNELRWRNSEATEAYQWLEKHVLAGTDPRDLLIKYVPQNVTIPDDIDETTLWKAVMSLVTEPARRQKLPHVNLLQDVINLIRQSNKIIVLTGAGVSVSCGIPDFRSKDGIYARLAVEYPDLPDPQAMFDIKYFMRNQKPFFKFAKEIYPGQFQPSISHNFIRLLEEHRKLLRNYTQNIDTLEQVAGIDNVVQCHGSFVTATCMSCERKVSHKDIEEDIMNQKITCCSGADLKSIQWKKVIPRCTECPQDDELAVMKPDIVFFGEGLSEEFHSQMEMDKQECDLLIVMGSSLKVRPVALIPNSLPKHIPQVLINREPLRHLSFDVELLGDCDYIVQELCLRLGHEWTEICQRTETARQVMRHEDSATPSTSGTSGIPSTSGTSGIPSTSSTFGMGQPAGSSNTEAIVISDTSRGDIETVAAAKDVVNAPEIDKAESSSEISVKTDLKPKTDNVADATSENDVQVVNTEGSKQTSSNVTNNEQVASTCSITEGSVQKTQQLDSVAANISSIGAISDVIQVDLTKEEPKDDVALPSSSHPQTNAKASVSADTTHSRQQRNKSPPETKIKHSSEVEKSIELNEACINIKVVDNKITTIEDVPLVVINEDLEKMRSYWKPRFVNLANQLEEGTFLYLPPNRYVFEGADYRQDLDDLSDGECISDHENNTSQDDVIFLNDSEQNDKGNTSQVDIDLNASIPDDEHNTSQDVILLNDSSPHDKGKTSQVDIDLNASVPDDEHNTSQCDTNLDDAKDSDKKCDASNDTHPTAPCDDETTRDVPRAESVSDGSGDVPIVSPNGAKLGLNATGDGQNVSQDVPEIPEKNPTKAIPKRRSSRNKSE